MSELLFKYGTMSSGKSIELIKTLFNYTRSGKNAMVAKPSVDTRTTWTIKSRLLEHEVRADVLIHPDTDLHLLVKQAASNNASAILIDECQFLNRGQIIQLSQGVDSHSTNVICFGLKTNFRGELFEGSRALFEFADSVTELKAVCRLCNQPAAFNLRVVNNSPVLDGIEVLVGDEEYVVVCRHHFFQARAGLLDLSELKQTNRPRLKHS